MRAAALTISTTRTAHEDESGPRLEELALELGASHVVRELVRDERALIEARLRALCDQPREDGERCALVLTSGGTGLSSDDVTPEATRAVIERELPGVGEAMRLLSKPYTPNWMLSRGLAGVRAQTLIVNLPGSPRAIEQLGGELAPALRHALALIAGANPQHAD